MITLKYLRLFVYVAIVYNREVVLLIRSELVESCRIGRAAPHDIAAKKNYTVAVSGQAGDTFLFRNNWCSDTRG